MAKIILVGYKIYCQNTIILISGKAGFSHIWIPEKNGKKLKKALIPAGYRFCGNFTVICIYER